VQVRRREGWHTAVAGVHVCYQGWAAGVEIGDHFGLFSHVVELGDTEVGHTEARSCCSCSSLIVISQWPYWNFKETDHVHGAEANRKGNAGRKAIVDAWAYNHVGRLLDHFLESCRS